MVWGWRVGEPIFPNPQPYPRPALRCYLVAAYQGRAARLASVAVASEAGRPSPLGQRVGAGNREPISRIPQPGGVPMSCLCRAG
jgi:hypothetical protein